MSLKHFLAFLLIAKSCHGLRFPKLFTNGMILQAAPIEANIWGFLDEDSETVDMEYSCNGNAILSQTFVPKQKEEIFEFKVKEEENNNCDFIIKQGSKILELENVLFGDVWVCSGQSNMEWPLGEILNAEEEIEKMSEYPNIKMFMLDFMFSDQPQDDLLKDQNFGWESTSNSDAVREFSAVCLLTARYMADTLGKDKVFGLIESSWGGTVIEAWSTPKGLDNCQIENSNDEEPQLANSVIYNAMIHPLLKMSIYGVLWYQGEANAEWNLDSYGCTFQQLINEWRNLWSTNSGTYSKFPFGFMQLASEVDDSEEIVPAFPMIRWYQTKEHGFVPNADLENCFMGVSLDTFDEETDIHPRNKQTPSRRLAIAGLKIAYNMKEFPFKGPSPVNIDVTMLDDKIQVNIFYDEDFTWNPIESEGFYICKEPHYTICNEEPGFWHLLPINSVAATSRSVSMVIDSSATAIAYLWATSPVLGMEALPIYSSNSYKLPAAPWLYVLN